MAGQPVYGAQQVAFGAQQPVYGAQPQMMQQQQVQMGTVVMQQPQGDTHISRMTPLDEYLNRPENAIWVKSAFALDITNEVLRSFVVVEITKFYKSIKETLSIKETPPSGVSCQGCSVETRCKHCDEILSKIKHEHWYKNPSFKNMCTGGWCTKPWEIAKCFMPQQKGYSNSSASDADFSASINVIINCKHFQAFGTSDPAETETDFSKSRNFRNLVMHHKMQKVSEDCMKENLDILINILNKIETSETKDDIEAARNKIKKIKTNQLKFKLEEVIAVRKRFTEATADELEKGNEQVQRERLLVNFEAGCRKALCRLTEDHISKQSDEKLSVGDFLSKIYIFPERKGLCSIHQDMLFPKSGTHADIKEWDLFVYCFILELDIADPLGNDVSLFVQEVKKIRDKLLLGAIGVTQNDLSDLCANLIDTDLKTYITQEFNKDSPDVNVISSNNSLVAWHEAEKDYTNKPISKKQLNNITQSLKEFEKHLAEDIDNMYHVIDHKTGYRGDHVTLQRANAREIVAECNLEVRGCDKKTEKALQEHITSSNKNDVEKEESLNDFCRKLNLRDVKPEEGSSSSNIILNVTCSSVTDVLDFWDCCIDGRAVKALWNVRNYYSRYYKCYKLEFDVLLSMEEVSSCFVKIRKTNPFVMFVKYDREYSVLKHSASTCLSILLLMLVSTACMAKPLQW